MPLHKTDDQINPLDTVTVAVSKWLRDQAAEFYEEGFQNLVFRHDKRLNQRGDYIEK